MLKAIKKVGFYALGAGLFFTGLARFHVKLHEFAMRQIQRAAQAGSEKALLLMGQILVYRGASEYNRVAGVTYLQDLVASYDPQIGDSKVFAQACFLLAEAYENPELVVVKNAADHSIQSSAHLYLKAAECGHIMAALRLSKAYKNGTLGLAKDSVLAEQWMTTFLQASKHHDQ